MPKYRVKLNIGSSTKTEHIEAKSVASVLAFFETLSVGLVTEILKVEYESPATPPIDDMNYHPYVKIYVANKDSNVSRQVVFHYLKPTKNEDDIIAACKAHLEIDGININSCYSCLVKS